MTKESTNSTAETSTAEQTGSSTLHLDAKDIQLLRWSLKAISGVLGQQEGKSIPKRESTSLIFKIDELDEKIFNQIKTAEENHGDPEEDTDSAEQLTLF